MKTTIKLSLLIAAAALATPALAQESSFGPKDAKETYYLVTNKVNLPLFVKYDYPGAKAIAERLKVRVRLAGPTDFDLPGFIAAVDQVCAQRPAGVSARGGWDPSLTESVKKCLALGVPTTVDDGDLPDSGRLAYIGTSWTAVGEAQAKAMMKALPNGGKIAVTSIINANNMREGVANEDANGDAATAAQVTAALSAAPPDLAGIAGFDSESGAGIVTALREAGKKPGQIHITAMEQTPDFFKTAKEGWTDGIIVQNRQLFYYYAVALLYDYNHNGLLTAGLGAKQGGVPIPNVVDTGLLVVSKDNADKVLSGLGVK